MCCSENEGHGHHVCMSMWLPKQQIPDTICSTCLLLFIHMRSARMSSNDCFIKNIGSLCATVKSSCICLAQAGFYFLKMSSKPGKNPHYMLVEMLAHDWSPEICLVTIVSTCLCSCVRYLLFEGVCLRQVCRRKAKHVLQCRGSTRGKRPWRAACDHI